MLNMKTIIKFSFLLLFISTFLFNACTKEENETVDPTASLVKLTEGYAPGAATMVQVYTESSTLHTGYTRFFLQLRDSASGSPLNQAKVMLMPMMDMGTMKHSAPVENPASDKAVDGLFSGAAVFIMSSMGGTWTMTFTVQRPETGKQGSYTIPVTVTDPAKATVKSFTALDDGQKYFIALIEPSQPKIGINDFEIGVYRKATMMSFPADSTMGFTIEPEMPTMGHGSPNNVNPTHARNGHYSGKVNFTMTGFWRVHLDAFHGTTAADTTQYFDIEF
jgi:hypothetical protein